MKPVFGYLIVLSSVILYAVLSPLLKKANQQIPPFTVIAVSMFALFITSLLFSLIFEKGAILKSIYENRNLFWVLIIVGLINAVGFWLAIQGYKYMPLWQQTLLGLLTPVLTGIFAYFILGEALSLKLFLGLAIMGAGLFVAIR